MRPESGRGCGQEPHAVGASPWRPAGGGGQGCQMGVGAGSRSVGEVGRSAVWLQLVLSLFKSISLFWPSRAFTALQASLWWGVGSTLSLLSLRNAGSGALGLQDFRLPSCKLRLSGCGLRASLLCSTWDLPGSGIEPASPALEGRSLAREAQFSVLKLNYIKN